MIQITFGLNFQLFPSALIDPAMIMNKIITMLIKVKIEFNNVDSLTPSIRNTIFKAKYRKIILLEI